ncbi:MAG TPA: hypothetical protein VN713_06930 [Sphingomicrobium sp.]|jgi:hypothetical protein|nr:hypothetical protein [Sphingomicrobium sp.]
MEEVSGRTFDGQALVETDGKNFTDCRFNSAILIYRGGEHPFFDACSFERDVSWRFLGGALKTIQFLQRIANDEGGENFIADLFAKGKFFADEPVEPQTLP